MAAQPDSIFILDDDASVRDSIVQLLDSGGLKAQSFEAAKLKIKQPRKQFDHEPTRKHRVSEGTPNPPLQIEPGGSRSFVQHRSGLENSGRRRGITLDRSQDGTASHRRVRARLA